MYVEGLRTGICGVKLDKFEDVASHVYNLLNDNVFSNFRQMLRMWQKQTTFRQLV